ncbi:MAG: Alanine-tRNA ligase [Microgenomates group bacterium GW2011_GWA2_46_16]|nr:MAG: Alanine-tRNA ligase [Microgenomates group bacterium GW2011_GWA2_46_16]
MKASEIRAKYLAFFAARGHAVIPAAPIVPPNDPTTLFTSSGMQQMVPYLKGEPHPMGKRIADSQPSFRAGDIEEVGDNRHTTMFEMLGNWSLGDYFKKEQLAWVWEFLTKALELPKEKLHVTIFAGDQGVPKDEEARSIWQSIGVAESHIHEYRDNWWSRAGGPEEMPEGEIGGPDSEVFYDFGTERQIHENSPWAQEKCHVNCDCGRYLEIGNSVFMQFVKQGDKLVPLPSQNVDFGGGFERIVAATQDKPDVFATDIYTSIIRIIEVTTGKKYEKEYQAPMRVVADHLRAASFMIAQGIEPSNKLQGYILRRLLRRAAVRTRALGTSAQTIFAQSVPSVVQFYADAGFIEASQVAHVLQVIAGELIKFEKALEKGIREIEKTDHVDEQKAFDLYQSLGFPWEITNELCREKGIILDQDQFEAIFAKHKEGSKTASAGMFRGGLADQSEITTKYHTATHLLHQALHDVLGEGIAQAGSNITSERLRFDYTYGGKPNPEQLKKIEEIVNQKIAENLPVVKTIEDKAIAVKSGARANFTEKYPDKVSVYSIGIYSKELCGGPHVEHTGLIGKMKIMKDEALGSGKRRIYGKLAE